MRSSLHAPLMDLDVALNRLLEQASALIGREELATFDADGRVLAEDLVSALQVPPRDNASMDGYAVRCADLSQSGQVLPVSQRIAAGHPPQPLTEGTCARIFTGAQIPPGADAVVMQEDAEVAADDPQSVRIHTVPVPGQWIRKAGEDVALGAVVLANGQRLTPASLGLAASLGRARLCVSARPRVALFSTGDELVMPGEVPPESMPTGAIYNSNRFFLRALLQRMGCEISDLGIVPDRREATLAALKSAADHHDLILTSGGVSVGEEDHIKPAVQQLGTLDLWQISMKPGKPFAYGTVRRESGTPGAAHFIGLPGNPVSSFVTFLLLVRPFLLALQGVRSGAALALPRAVMLPAHFSVSKPDKRREFLRVRRNDQGGLELFPNQSSGVLTSVAWADGLVDKPAGSTIAHGDRVPFISFADCFA